MAAPNRESGLIPREPVVAFGVLANVCYSLGPLVELTLHKLWGRAVLPVGPSLFRMGLTVSVRLALLPILIVIPFTLARLLGLGS